MTDSMKQMSRNCVTKSTCWKKSTKRNNGADESRA
jgi:hypothetical protein